jgi:hypothetical protein
LRSSDKTEAEKPQASKHGRARTNAGNTSNTGNAATRATRGVAPHPAKNFFVKKFIGFSKSFFGAQTIVCEKKKTQLYFR